MSVQDGSCSYASSANMAAASGSMRRRLEDQEFTLRVYPGSLAEGTIYCPVTARKNTTAAEAIECLIERLRLDRTKCYVLAEVKEFGGEEWILNPGDCPVQRMMLWPRSALENRGGLGSGDDYRFLLREKNLDGSIHYGGSLQMWLRVTEERRRMVERGFLPQPAGSDPPTDLCALPELTERALLESLRARFRQEKIYTYIGSILIVVNPFQFLPIYNPKYVKLYDNHALGKLEPHIYAVADVAYHAMLQRRRNQCIVISGESGSGKTQSTNFLIHHLTALSQKGFASGVEQIILGAGPVLEAFGNAKTAHNNNSSRFGKFIQVNYQASGTVRGAYVEKYLLEKSRLVYQEHNERNYHVFYYLLAGASEDERKSFHLLQPEEYHYLNQMTKKSHKLRWDNCYESELQDCFSVEGEDLKHDFERLQLAMEMVGFLPATRKQIFSLLSAILHLGNIRYKKKTYRDDSIDICNPEVLPIVSELLEVKEEMLLEALTTRKTVTVGERLIVPYKLAEAGTVRDSMAKSLYSALFDWIVFRTNHALLNNKDLEDNSKIFSIGVLDIFGFEDYENNSFEQFCINFANERLQHYFNQHIFKLEQEEYRAEGISWHTIDYIDNSSCINLISKKPTALFHLLDEECNFPQASNQTLLDKFKRQHEGNSYIEFPAVMEPAFIIRHYAGKVKYGVKDFREKNTDHMRPDVVALLKSSKNAFICGLMGIDPVATFRWAVLRAYFRALVAFREAGRRHTHKKTGHDSPLPCATVKTVDSFSFLHHPVHQRSLEILQRCKDEKYSISRKNPRSPLSHLQGANAPNEKASWDGFGVGCKGRRPSSGRLSSAGSPTALGEDGIFVNSSNSKLLERAQGILLRNKNCKIKPSLPKHLLDVKSLRHLSSVTLHDRITKSLLHLHKKKKPPSISAQFQASLSKLMETLNQSEPYFVKCIRSNAEKLPLRFNDSLVLRQLRYTGMLETVRIRQSGYSIKYTFQDFVGHFHVLLPRGTSATKSGIREFFRQIHLMPAGYQVGNTTVFLREAERQRLQTLLHQEVLRRIVMLQRRFRAVLERKTFVRMRLAARIIQRWWRCCLLRESAVYLRLEEEQAVVCLQTAWRRCRQRRTFLRWRRSAVAIQRSWRIYCRRRTAAAIAVQAAWRGFVERRRYCETYRTVMLLQAMGRGYLARCRLQELKQQREAPAPVIQGPNDDLAPSQRDGVRSLSGEPADDSALAEKDSEQSRSVDEASHKTRSKRESRRMRELEQAQFSLELLKVRTGHVGTPPEGEAAPDDSTFPLEDHRRASPLGSLDSFEMFTVEDMETEGSGGFRSQPTAPRECFISDQQSQEIPARDSNHNETPKMESPLRTEGPRATFYIASDQSPIRVPNCESPGKSYKDRRESTSRKPVVVLISMQKESPLEEGPLVPHTPEGTRPSSQLTHISGLEVGSPIESLNERTTPSTFDEGNSSMVPSSTPHEASPKVPGLCSSQGDIKITPEPKASVSPVAPGQQKKKTAPPGKGVPSPLLDTKPPKAQKKSSAQTVIVNMTEKPSNAVFSPPRRKLPFSKSDKDLVNQGRSLSMFRDDSRTREQVGRPGPKKKPRMSRTRSDFLTRCNSEGATQSDDDDDEYYVPAHSRTLPPSLCPPRARPKADCHSDSEMDSHKDPKKIHKTMSSGDLGKVEALRKTSSQDGRMRGKMRFWSKSKQGGKKVSREKLASRSESAAETPERPSPPRSPDAEASSPRGRRDSKENKEPSPKMKRRFKMNTKFSHVTGQMDDGKSIRYKDLYALFEHILEKSMRLEQRDWNESPVKVWVNTFKVFLDEFMTEYKPMQGTIGRAAKRERKKSRKKETDIVSSNNGHIFKSTQYSIPTYCEYCSSLIWMMDRACVCKLCRYACHRKCCSKMATKCSKKYDPELSPRQFAVELSRLTSEERNVPQLVEKLINYIEMHGLYTEGIYRKSGSTNKIKELRQGLDTDVSSVNLDDYNIHVIASVLKQWLRDLPSPLMTFELYEEFLRAMGQSDKREVIRGVYSVIDQLSRTHLSTLERLIFHLVRIALQEDTNRMSANALAIVFAPCVLRCPDTIDPLQSVQDISKTTACVELIITEQMSKYKARLKDINSLEFAESKAKSRLTHVRRSMKPVLIAVRFMSIARTATPVCMPLCPHAPTPHQHPHCLSRPVLALVPSACSWQKLISKKPLDTKANKKVTKSPHCARLQGKSRVRQGSGHAPSPPLSPRPGPPVADGGSAGAGAEEMAEAPLSEQQQLAMQQEERILTEQIESLQREKEELTYEMLILEPRASDDETPESEASIGTADSSENITMETEGANTELPESGACGSRKWEPKSRRPMRRHPDSVDSADSASACSNQPPSASPSPHYRFRSSSSGPLLASYSPGGAVAAAGEMSRPSHRLRLSRSSPREPSGGHRREPEFGSAPQQLVLYGSNEFMV
ncbi:unconventional myosin-IXa-like [Hippocampus comes]|uniref:unconventional myosin-IXa-like n=1 Tax=Hippocampus comes TaxID=109280 RepID=UPI00094EC602|nr:PREDICTED: unconventional myosin-IXa-like [Hippocampus comes]